MKGVIIQASSRSKGHTHQLVEFLQQKTGFDIIDLKRHAIQAFDYEFLNQDDDFLPLIRQIASDYQLIIFATPVYWYTMSGILKNFIDRISDCLKIEKETGRKLRGKSLGIISCSSESGLKPGFHMPFIETAAYLGMEYIGDVHGWIENEDIPDRVEEKLLHFSQQILSSNKELI